MLDELTWKETFQLLGSNLAARLGLNGRSVVRLVPKGDLLLARLPDRDVAVPSVRRWRHYRRGWAARLDRLAREQFGVGEVVFVTPGQTVLDIGANVGEFSTAMADLGARVFAIEGDPTVMKCLEFNMAGKPDIKLCQTVIWKTSGSVTFYSIPKDADSSAIAPLATEGFEALTLPALSLDDLTASLGVEEIDLIKCDAEGAEPEVIEGAQTILRRTRQVAFDTGAERQGQETSDTCETMLTALGFRVFHQTRRGRKITFGIRD
jgi:FkbM family methyltransferase